VNSLSNQSLPSGYIQVEEEGEIVIRSKFWYKRPKDLKGKTGKWSKYGGAEKNTYAEQVKDWWYCQSCRDVQPEEISPLLVKGLFLDDADESLRVCPMCYANHCSNLLSRISDN